MLSSKTLALVLSTTASALVWAASPPHIPFVPSTVQRPNAHVGRFGLITIVSYGPYGQKTTSTQVIDLDAYISSGATKMVLGAKALDSAMKSRPVCSNPGYDGTCNDVGGNAGAGGNFGNGGQGHNINPGGSGPGSSGPQPPDPPNPNSVPWDVGVVTYTQFYDNGAWEQTTTYSREVFPETQSDGEWGPAVTVETQVKGH